MLVVTLEGDGGDLQQAVELGTALHGCGAEVDLFEEGVELVVDVVEVVPFHDSALELLVGPLLLAEGRLAGCTLPSEWLVRRVVALALTTRVSAGSYLPW